MTAATRRKPRRSRKRRRDRFRRRAFALAWRAAIVFAVVAFFFLLHAHTTLSGRLEGPVWDVPTRVVSAELPLRSGDVQPLDRLVERLRRTGHVEADRAERPGTFVRRGRRLDVRPLDDPLDGTLTLDYRGDRILEMRGPDGYAIDEWTLPPEPIAVLYGDVRIDREIVPFEAIPPVLVQAVLAAEDSRFYDHFGIDPFAVLRASAKNVRAGRVVQGGSTITQQTVKNLFLDARRTWWRKAREAAMSLMLEWREPKDRILELYLNEMYLGQRGAVSVCGVGAASKFYFGKPVDRLTTGEAALLAGMIRSPGGYNPYKHPERALERRDAVLDAMLAGGVLDADRHAAAKSERPTFMDSGVPTRPSPWALDFVLDEARERLGERAVAAGGATLVTTLDLRMQHAAERALRETLEALDPDGKLEGAVVVLDPRDGALRALVGGRDYGRSQFDRARDAKRQPGSVFKPFVYAAAFETDPEEGGLTAATPLEDAPIEIRYDGKAWSPRNYDREFRGPLTVRDALVESRNVPAVLAGERVGMRRVADLARRMGIEAPLDPTPALALGTSEVTPLEMATAYATFASGGVLRKPHGLSAWTEADGGTTRFEPERGERVIDERVAFLVNDVLSDVFDEGTARRARSLGFRGLAAGKTGTTNDTRDSWFVGYTPEWVALVWIGADDNSRTGRTGATGALTVWSAFVREAGESGVRRRFHPPDGVIRRSIDVETGELARRECDEVREEWFLRGTEPNDRCDLHRGGLRRWFQRWREQRQASRDRTEV